MIHCYSNKTQHSLLAVLLTVLLGTTAMTASFATQALAQDDEEEFFLEDIVVTGSRIVRSNMESASPMVTVDEQLFDQSATLAIETQLNKLPQFTPTIDIPTSGGDIQPTARNTPGEATVALRGLGANRSLVLINGRRGTPANGMGVMNINTIPIAAIEYVEAISGGASAVYGADAMAGVVNFIMKDDFEGLEIDVQMGITEEGDNFEYQVSSVWGADVADGRGNIMMALSYNDRDDALQGDREWYRESWADPSRAGTQFWAPYTAINLGFGNLPPASVLNEVMELPEGEGYTSAANVTIYDDGNGNAFTGLGMGCSPAMRTGVPAAVAAGLVDGFRIKELNNGCLGYNNIQNYLIFPMDRYNMYMQGNFEVFDWIGVFGQAYFSDVNTHTIQEAGIITVTGEHVPFYPEYSREVIPDEILTILDARPDPNGVARLQTPLPVPRESLTHTKTYNLTGGLEGVIPGIEWTWEAFYSYGETSTFTLQEGYGSVERLRIVMGGVIDYADDGSPIFYDGYKNFGQGFQMTGNAEQGGVGGATATCTSGINPFDYSNMTMDCWDAVKADIKTNMIMQQTVWEANTQGRIADLPAGELRGAVGLSHRKNVFDFISDTINSEGVSFHDQILGLNPAQDSFGQISVKEVYAELLIPVLSDLPGIKKLNLELGGRSSDYSTTGRSETYKILADWRTTDWLRFRGGYNRAERAPNIAELFLNPEMIFGVLSGGDPCSTLNPNDYSANPNTNPDHYYDVITLCGQKMEGTGNVEADDLYYGDDYRVIREDPSLATGQSSATFGFFWPENVGNDALEPEIADTWTLGAVFDSPLDNPWLADLRVSLDYYSIEITDAIGQQSGALVMRQCLDPMFNATLDPDSSYCDGMPRDARNGGIGQMLTSFYNNGAFETSGIDLSINWGMDAGPGRVNVNSRINYLIDKKSTELAAVDPLLDYTGTFGPNQNGLNGNSYEWRALTSVSYRWGDLNLTIRWDYKDAIDQEVVARGLPGTSGVGAYHLFDLLGNYSVSDNLRLRFGIENLLNEEPPVAGVNPNDPNGMYGGTFMPGNYDTNGRRFYLGARVNFD